MNAKYEFEYCITCYVIFFVKSYLYFHRCPPSKHTSTSKMLSPAFKGIAGQKNSYIGEKPNPNGKPAALMIGPVLPFVQAKNNFKPSEISEDVPVRLGREMVGPIYQ